jgi:hypothetical protein
MRFIRSNWLLPAVLTGLCCVGAFNARANLLTTFPEMGDLLRWGAFSLGDGIVSTDTTDQFEGTTDIYGDVGVASEGDVTMNGNATIHGDLYWRSNGTLIMKGNSNVTGTKHHNAASDSILDNGVNEAKNTSMHAASLASTFPYMGLTSITSSMTITSSGALTVLNLTDLVLTNKSILTLNGSASDNFVINVSRNFSLTSQSKIVLSGGLGWDDVLFNIKGTENNVTLDGQSSMSGILMANKRTVSIAAASIVNGEVIANKIKLSGSSQIVHPPVTSP